MFKSTRLPSIVSSMVIALALTACSSATTPASVGSEKPTLVESVTTTTSLDCANAPDGLPDQTHPQNCCTADGTACIDGVMSELSCPAPYSVVSVVESECCTPLNLPTYGGLCSGSVPDGAPPFTLPSDLTLLPSICGLGWDVGGCGAEQYCVFPASGGSRGQCLPLPADCDAFPQGVCGSTRVGPNPTEQFFASACDARAAGDFVLYAGPCR